MSVGDLGDTPGHRAADLGGVQEQHPGQVERGAVHLGDLCRIARRARGQLSAAGVARDHVPLRQDHVVSGRGGSTGGQRLPVTGEQLGHRIVQRIAAELARVAREEVRRERRGHHDAVGPLRQLRRGGVVEPGPGRESVLEVDQPGRRLVVGREIPVRVHGVPVAAVDLQLGPAHRDRAAGRHRRWALDDLRHEVQHAEDERPDHVEQGRLALHGFGSRCRGREGDDR